MGKGHRSRDTYRRSRSLSALTLTQPFANSRPILIPTRHTGLMPLKLLISKHRVILTITGSAFAASLVGSLIALVIAINDLARILLPLALAF